MGCTRKCCKRQALERIFSRTAIVPLSDVALREGCLAPRIHRQWTLIVDQALDSVNAFKSIQAEAEQQKVTCFKVMHRVKWGASCNLSGFNGHL